MKPSLSGLNAWLCNYSAAPLICMLLILAGFSAAPAHAAKFPIATGGAAMNFAFDGTNYLVGVENHQTTPTSIGAQLIDAGGNKVGNFIATGINGISTNAAFDGTNYLLIWENDPGGTGAGRFQIYGQLMIRICFFGVGAAGA